MEIVHSTILEATDMLCIRSTENLLGLKEVNHKKVKQLPDRTEIVITQSCILLSKMDLVTGM